jgi:putative addiction module component (TIGR02574 family)
MNKTTKSLIDQILDLPAAERLIVAEQILRSLDAADSDIEAAWLAEAENRLNGYESGSAETVAASDVLGDYAQQ